MSHNHDVYEKRIVAFLDILGFKTMIDDSMGDTLLRRKIRQAMDIIYSLKKTELQKREKGICISTFSDSVVISYPIDGENSLSELLEDIVLLQINLGAIGIMIRGGISVGNVYHDGNIIFGPAMNEAYYLENKKAYFPRVVVQSKTIQQCINYSFEANAFIDLNGIYDYLKRDDYQDESGESDLELFFLDFLRQDRKIIHYGDEYYAWLKSFRTSIISGLNRYSPNGDDFELMNDDEKKQSKKIFEKYRWILKYWNSVVLGDSSHLPVPPIDLPDQEKFIKNYRKLKIKNQYPYY